MPDPGLIRPTHRPAPWALAGLVLLGACAGRPIRVESSGARPASPHASFVLGQGSDPQDRAVQSLQHRGLIARTPDKGVAELQVAMLTRPARVGVCKTMDPALPDGCSAWLAKPDRARRPFGAATDYRLSLRLVDPATGGVLYRAEAAIQRRGPPPPDLEDRLLAAALRCDGCAAGSLTPLE